MAEQAPPLGELIEMTDDELIARYDRQARTTGVGIRYFLDEFYRRAQKRSTDSMLRLTKWILAFTLTVTLATIINLVIVILEYL